MGGWGEEQYGDGDVDGSNHIGIRLRVDGELYARAVAIGVASFYLCALVLEDSYSYLKYRPTEYYFS